MFDVNKSFARARDVARRFGATVTGRAERARSRTRRRVLVLGDSHAAVFQHPSWRSVPVRLDVHAVGAATLYGLTKRDSASGARGVFDAALAPRRRGRPPEAVVTLLGEVDCGFLIWEWHRTKGTPLDALVAGAVERYEQFLATVAAVAPPIVLSAPLPTLVDVSMIGDYARLRRNVVVPRPDRTALVRSLNHAIAAVCERHGYTFVDLDDVSTGADGEVSPLLVSADPHNHHYDPVVYARLLQRTLAVPLRYEIDEPTDQRVSDEQTREERST